MLKGKAGPRHERGTGNRRSRPCYQNHDASRAPWLESPLVRQGKDGLTPVDGGSRSCLEFASAEGVSIRGDAQPATAQPRAVAGVSPRLIWLHIGWENKVWFSEPIQITRNEEPYLSGHDQPPERTTPCN